MEFVGTAIAIILAIVVLNRFLQPGGASPPVQRTVQAALSSFPARRLGNSNLFWVEGAIIGGEWHQVGGAAIRRYRVVKGEAVTLRGWAVDPRSRKPARAVRVLIDGRIAVIEPVNDYRPEVAAPLKLVDANACGFLFALPTDALPGGAHHITFEAAASDGAGYYLVRPDLTLDVSSS